MSEKYNRLSKIVDKLYCGEELRIASLAKEFHTSTKTIQRDLKERLKSDFLIREGNRFRLRSTQKDQRSAFAISVLENLIQEIGGSFETDANEILDKSLSSSSLFETPLKNITHKIQEILQIQKALKMQNKLSFDYKNKKYLHTQPIDLCATRHCIYLRAYLKNEIFFFSLEHITHCKLSRQKYLISTQNDDAQQEQSKVSLFAYPQASKHAQAIQWGEQQECWQDNDGSLIIEFFCKNEDALISEILSQIPHIIVLEPQSLKDRIEAKILAYIKKQ